MGKFTGVLLASDYDDTLVAHDETMPPRNVEALDYFVREGGAFTISTGRVLDALRPKLSLVPVNAPVVLSNGTRIHNFQTEETIFQAFLPETALLDLQRVYAAFPRVATEVYVGETIYCCNANAVTEAHLQRIRRKGTPCKLADVPGPWLSAMLEEDRPYLEEVQRYILDCWPERYEAIFANQYLLELTRKGCSKGSGVRRVAEFLHIAPKDIYCIGDNQNDVSMMEAAAKSYCPAQSAEAALVAADLVVSPCGDGALADVVADLDRRYGAE